MSVSVFKVHHLRIIVIVTLCVLGALNSHGSPLSQRETHTNRGTTCTTLPTLVEYARYNTLSRTWVVMITPPKTTRECVIAAVAKLHNENPSLHFELFDYADGNLSNYVLWSSTGMSNDLLYAERWIKKHHVASLYLLSNGLGSRACKWVLKFEKGEDVVFDQADCKQDKN